MSGGNTIAVAFSEVGVILVTIRGPRFSLPPYPPVSPFPLFCVPTLIYEIETPKFGVSSPLDSCLISKAMNPFFVYIGGVQCEKA
jgi:hypothetical protein